jgi:hypothetical protein
MGDRVETIRAACALDLPVPSLERAEVRAVAANMFPSGRAVCVQWRDAPVLRSREVSWKQCGAEHSQ